MAAPRLFAGFRQRCTFLFGPRPTAGGGCPFNVRSTRPPLLVHTGRVDLQKRGGGACGVFNRLTTSHTRSDPHTMTWWCVPLTQQKYGIEARLVLTGTSVETLAYIRTAVAWKREGSWRGKLSQLPTWKGGSKGSDLRGFEASRSRAAGNSVLCQACL